MRQRQETSVLHQQTLTTTPGAESKYRRYLEVQTRTQDSEWTSNHNSSTESWTQKYFDSHELSLKRGGGKGGRRRRLAVCSEISPQPAYGPPRLARSGPAPSVTQWASHNMKKLKHHKLSRRAAAGLRLSVADAKLPMKRVGKVTTTAVTWYHL